MDGSNALRQFDFKISRYFLDFLEIDFKRQQAPRRRIQLKNSVGHFPLRRAGACRDETAGWGSRIVRSAIAPAINEQFFASR
jgi:hypothetical protein